MVTIDKDAFLKKLLETFSQEAKEHIDNLSNGLLELKKSTNSDEMQKIVETLFREAHSFKGASRSVNISEIEEICKAMEDVFSHYKLSRIAIPHPLIEAMLECTDLLNILVFSNEMARRSQKPHVQKVIDNLHGKLNSQNLDTTSTDTLEVVPPSKPAQILENLVENTIEPTLVEKVPDVAPMNDTLRISIKKLNSIMQKSEEMLFAKIASKRYIEQLKIVYEGFDDLKKGDLTECQLKITNLQDLLLKTIKQVKSDAREIDLHVDTLLAQMKEALMLPFSTIFYTLPKIVHDMAKSAGKEAVLNVIGGEIEIDRRVLEEMHDPLLHLLRNAVDHGIESSEVRRAKGKSDIGNITLSLFQVSATKVELKVSDDGAGIDPQKVLEVALKKKIIDSQMGQNLTTQGVLNLIFESGVTTSKTVTDLSGRGLGLAIVQDRAQQLGGDVHVNNLQEGGSEFSIILPLSMATFSGVIVSQNNQKFIFPIEHIVRVVNIELSKIKNIEGKEVIQLDDHVVPFFHLSSILNLPSVTSSKIPVILLRLGKNMMAVGVEVIEAQEEIMVKSLGKQLIRVKNIAGAALLSSDSTALILNISDLFKSVHTLSSKQSLTTQETIEIKRQILVVDDSPTTRALLQNILEMVGYDVKVAVDGLDAYEKLKIDSFDLVVSDVDMPRMNGIELTKAIRKDSKTSELPVILVTSLEEPKDKENGMDAGANAYIIKSTFDQNNLIEHIQLLIDEG